MEKLSEARFLVVEDNAALARSVARVLGIRGKAVISGSLAEARNTLAEGHVIAGVVLDLNLPDGSGFELLQEIGEREFPIPTMVLSGDSSPEALRRAQLHGALFVPKPASPENLLAFVDWSTSNQHAGIGLRRQVNQLAQRYHLSAREREVVLEACRGVPRSELATRLAVEPSTVKTLVRRLLKKCGNSTLGDVVALVHGAFFEEVRPDDHG